MTETYSFFVLSDEQLASTIAGTSGAKRIGVSSISGISAQDVQAALEVINTKVAPVASVDGRTGAITLGDLYVNETDHTKAAHDALGINADTVDGSHASAFAAASHVGSRDGHPVATTTLDGFMASGDKAKVHDRAHNLSSTTDHPDIKGTPTNGQIFVYRSSGASGAGFYPEEPAAASVAPADETTQGKVEEVGKKALAKRDEIQSAQSVEEPEAIQWEESA